MGAELAGGQASKLQGCCSKITAVSLIHGVDKSCGYWLTDGIYRDVPAGFSTGFQVFPHK